MAFVNGADVITTCISGNPIVNGSAVVFTMKGGPGVSGVYQREDPQVNRIPDSGGAYSVLHGRFFPQFLFVVSGAYDYSNG